MDPWIWLGLSIFVGYGIAAITGFGSVIIALSMGALMLPIATMLPILVPLNVVMNGYITVKHRHHIHWPTLLKVILPLMVSGTALGYGLQPWLGDRGLQLVLGVLVIWFAGRELWRSAKAIAAVPHHKWWTQSWMFVAGITHGLFASGGPLLVYALAGVAMEKSAFRATLTAVWLVLNTLLLLAFAVDGSLLPSLGKVAWLMPVLIAGLVLGEYLHHRVQEDRFRQLVYAMLLITGTLLIVSVAK